MCLALPGRIVGIDGIEADVVVGAAGGEARRAGLQLHPEARVGDFVLVKTGLVVEVLSEGEAKDLTAFFAEMVALLEEADERV
jgi:hydrogenase expression/formation protein HypC